VGLSYFAEMTKTLNAGNMKVGAKCGLLLRRLVKLSLCVLGLVGLVGVVLLVLLGWKLNGMLESFAVEPLAFSDDEKKKIVQALRKVDFPAGWEMDSYVSKLCFHKVMGTNRDFPFKWVPYYMRASIVGCGLRWVASRSLQEHVFLEHFRASPGAGQLPARLGDAANRLYGVHASELTNDQWKQLLQINWMGVRYWHDHQRRSS
jgi:hypothetical protein